MERKLKKFLRRKRKWGIRRRIKEGQGTLLTMSDLRELDCEDEGGRERESERGREEAKQMMTDRVKERGRGKKRVPSKRGRERKKDRWTERKNGDRKR
jgi:hypothetical protein